MLRCLAEICGSTGEATPEEKLVEQRPVVKPVLRLDEPDDTVKVRSLQELASRAQLELAPPGASEPVAAVSSNFQTNSARLLVLVPSAGDAGTWDAELGVQGSVVPLLRWAEANAYATAVFSHAALTAKPAETWDRVLKGSPARCVSVMVAAGMLRCLQTALSPVHPLLFSRFRSICVRGADSMEDLGPLPDELRQHLEGATAVIPSNWQDLPAQVSLQCLFELLRDREDRWQQLELMKYTGFQGLKENDMPGLRRMGVDQRVKRLDRNRDDDELARLLKKHDQAKRKNPNDAELDDEEEPGVD